MSKKLLAACSLALLGPASLCGAVDVQVCIREQLTGDAYPHTVPGTTAGVSVRAFGLEPGVPLEEWRQTPLEEIVDLFTAYIAQHNIADAQRFVLDFEKDFAHVHVANREIIERSIQAVRQVTPDADISLFGTPFPPINGSLSPVFSDPDYLDWITGLGVGYAPVLYIAADANGDFPALEDVEADAELSLSVFPASESTPYLWHKWRNGGNWMTNPDIIDTHPDLDPLRAQLDVLEALGVPGLCFWHGADDPAITEMLEVLFADTPGDFDGDGDVDLDDFGVFVDSFQNSPQGGPPFAPGDFDEDGDVDLDDFGVFVDAFQDTSLGGPPAAIPEPTALALLAIAAGLTTASGRIGR